MRVVDPRVEQDFVEHVLNFTLQILVCELLYFGEGNFPPADFLVIIAEEILAGRKIFQKAVFNPFGCANFIDRNLELREDVLHLRLS